MRPCTISRDFHHHDREIRADILLRRNIEALIRARGVDDQALALWCGHQKAWISKILAGQRGISLKDVGKIADFFGLSVAQLFQYGISTLYERRSSNDRRSGTERRAGDDRRKSV